MGTRSKPGEEQEFQRLVLVKGFLLIGFVLQSSNT